ncbi:hypothetical protein WN943_019062 [Citrus x changshan-huyou]
MDGLEDIPPPKAVFLGKDSKTKVQAEHVRHMDNFEDFNSYPWGRVCFMKNLKSLKKTLVDRVRIHKKKIIEDPKHKNEAYTLAGFPMVFQIWAYEAMPDFLGEFAVHNKNRIPRILNWTTLRNVQYDDLLKYIFNNKNVCILPTIAKLMYKDCVEEIPGAV